MLALCSSLSSAWHMKTAWTETASRQNTPGIKCKPKPESPLKPWEGKGAGEGAGASGIMNSEKQMSVTSSYPLCGHLLHSAVPGIGKSSINGSNNDYQIHYRI